MRWRSSAAGTRAWMVIEELAEFPRPLTAVKLADHFAGLGIERGEQRGGVVPGVVMRAALDLPGTHRQHRLRPIEGLDLRLFVHAQHERPVGRIQIEPDNIADLLDEQGSFDSLELGPMRLQCEGAPNPADGRLAQAAPPRHRACTPMGGVPRRRLQSQPHLALHLLIGDFPRSARARFIKQPIEALDNEALPPAPDRQATRLQGDRAAS